MFQYPLSSVHFSQRLCIQQLSNSVSSDPVNTIPEINRKRTLPKRYDNILRSREDNFLLKRVIGSKCLGEQIAPNADLSQTRKNILLRTMTATVSQQKISLS